MKKHFLALSVLAAFALPTTVWAHGDGHHHHHHDHGEHHQVDYSADFAAAQVATTIELSQCWIRNIPTPSPSAGYFVVDNKGEHDIKLLAAASEQYHDIMLHQTVDEDGMAKMKMADEIVIPAGQSLHFKPGGYHAMLEQPASAVSVGDQVELSLLFNNQQKVVTQCEVKAPGSRSFED